MSNKKVLSNLLWRFAERCGAQGVAFIVSIVLARLLSPNDYGLIALVTVFTSILNVFVDSGMGNSLIQKKTADDIDFSSVFYFNISICSVLYLLIFACAPLIADFYKNEQLIPIVRVLSITLIISGVKNVQQAYISRNMKFKLFFFATIGGTLLAAVVGIVMAYKGFGVWALVTQQIVNASVDTIILWITVKWRPKKVFSLQRLKVLFSYGWKLLISSIIDTVYNDIRQLVIGKMYSSSDLAQYNQGKKLPNLIVTNINSSIDSVLLPTMSKEQDNAEHVKSMTRRSIKISTYIMAPLMMGLAFVAPELISIILTDKWLPCVPFLRIFCITYMFYPIQTANLNAIKAMGRSDMFLKLEIIKKIIGVILLISTMWFGVLIMAYSLLINSILSQIINSWPNKKLLKYSYIEQIKDMMPQILLSLLMGIIVYLMKFIGLSIGLTLIIQIISGVILYIIGSKIMHLDSYEYLYKTVKSFIHKRGER